MSRESIGETSEIEPGTPVLFKWVKKELRYVMSTVHFMPLTMYVLMTAGH